MAKKGKAAKAFEGVNQSKSGTIVTKHCWARIECQRPCPSTSRISLCTSILVMFRWTVVRQTQAKDSAIGLETSGHFSP